ncbi:MAG: MFS transporter [Thermoplasmatota archaeon]
MVLENRDKKYIRNRIAMFLLVVMATFLIADQYLLPPNYQNIMAEFAINEAKVGMISTIFVISGVIVTSIWGFLSDIKGRKKLLVVGVLLGEIPCFLTAFVQSYPQLLLTRIFTGIGVGSLIPIGYSLISDIYDEDNRGKGFGYIHVALGLGSLVGMIFAGMIASWRTPFIMVSVPNFFIAPIFYFVLVEPKRGEGDKELKKSLKEGAEYKYDIDLDTIKKSFKTRTNLLIFTQGIMGMVPWGVLTYWLVSFLMVTKGMVKTTATFVLLIVGTATVIGSLVGGVLGDYFERKFRGGRAVLVGVSIFIGMIASIGLILYPIPSTLDTVDWILIGVYSFVFLQMITFPAPNVPAVISHVNLPEDRGTVFGVFNILNQAGMAVGPWFAGSIVGVLLGMGYVKPWAYQNAMIIGALFWLPSSIIWLWLKKQYPDDRDDVKDILEKRAEELD